MKTRINGNMFGSALGGSHQLGLVQDISSFLVDECETDEPEKTGSVVRVIKEDWDLTGSPPRMTVRVKFQHKDYPELTFDMRVGIEGKTERDLQDYLGRIFMQALT